MTLNIPHQVLCPLKKVVLVFNYETTVRNITTWKRDNFNDQGQYQKTDSLNVSQVLNDEANYN